MTGIKIFSGTLRVRLKVKCTLVQPLRLCTGNMTRRGSRGIALPFHDHSTRRGWGVSVTPQPLFNPRKTLYPLYRRLGGPQGRYGQVRKIFAPTGIRSPDRPARSQSLHGLRYPNPHRPEDLLLIRCFVLGVLWWSFDPMLDLFFTNPSIIQISSYSFSPSVN